LFVSLVGMTAFEIVAKVYN